MMLSVRRSLFSVLVATGVIAGGVVVSADDPGDGVLDPSFGDGGIVMENIGTVYPSARNEVEAQADGKVVIAGTVDSGEGAWTTVIERLLPDGSLDQSFGVGGQVPIDLNPDQYEYIVDVSIDGSGRIFVLAAYGQQMMILGLEANGDRIDGFGDDGIVRNTPVDGAEFRALAVASDGSILVGGRTDNSSGNPGPAFSTTIWKFTPVGVLDTAFGTAGVKRHDLTGNSEIVDIDVLANGSVVAVARLLVGGSFNWSSVVMKLTSSGVLDASFDTDGIVELDLGGNTLEDEPSAVHVLASSEILIAATLETANGGSEFAVARLDATGALDTSFDTDGVAVYGPGDGTREYIASSLDVLADGTVVVAGQLQVSWLVDSTAALVAFTSAGAAVNSFGVSDGDAGIPAAIARDTSVYTDVAVSGIGAQERITVVGITAGLVALDSVVAGVVVRFGVSGLADAGFGDGGVVDRPMSDGMGTPDLLVDAVELDDGRSISVGYELAIDGYRTRRSMHLRDGSLDTSWGVGGHLVDSVQDGLALVAALDSQGRLLVAYFNAPSGLDVRRYLPDGSLDTSFGTAGVAERPAGFAQFGVEVAPVLTFDSQGRVLIATDMVTGSALDAIVYRLTPDGVLDTSFGTGGSTTVDVDHFDGFTSLAFDSEGRIVLGGYSVPSPAPTMYLLVRLTADGALDTSFGNAGVVADRFVGDDLSLISGVSVTEDGKFIVLGVSQVGTTTTARLLRLNEDASVDASFPELVVPATLDEFALPFLTVRPDGRVLLSTVVGDADGGGETQLRVVGVDGTLDTEFGTDGVLSLSGFAARTARNAVRGDLLLAGSTQRFDFDHDRTLVRVLGELMIVPAAPAAPTLAAADGALTVTWTAPIDDGAPRPTGYLVTLSPGGATCSTTGAVTCEITGLTNGTAYTAVVRAANRIGPGPDSPASAAATPTAPTTTLPATTVPTTTTVPMELPATGGSGGSGVGILALAVGALAALLGRRQAAR